MQKAVKKQVVASIKEALPVSVVGTDVKVYWNAPNADVRFTCPSCSTPVRVTWKLPEELTVSDAPQLVKLKVCAAHKCAKYVEAAPQKSAVQVEEELATAQASLKRKSEQLRVLKDAKKAPGSSLEPRDKEELQRHRGNETKRAKRRQVPIEAKNAEEFENREAKSEALGNPELGVEAAFRYWCKSSSRKLEDLLLATISKHNLE